MAVVVIGGSGQNAGKTAVGCSLLQALREFEWTAVKLSPHDHGVTDSLWEELVSSSLKDTGRYLAAGAYRAFLLDGRECPSEALTRLRNEGDPDVTVCGLIVESNRVEAASITRMGERSCSLAVLSGTPMFWKDSLASRAATADALVLTGGFCCDELSSPLRGKRVFQLEPGRWSSPELLAFVRKALT